MKLGRIPVFDERSRLYSVSAIIPEKREPVTREWTCTEYLNQGLLSACVGFSWAHCLASYPEACTGVTTEFAIKTYKTAKTLDDIPGDNYEGTSVLAGIKAIKAAYPSAIEAYHWAFGLEQLITAVGYVSPCVLGINWYSSMYAPFSDGMVAISGAHVGGHAILATGVYPEAQKFRLHNSWGAQWGDHGDCYISFRDMERLLHERGEACVPTGKRSINLASEAVAA